jgi:hypothetical protein
MVHEGKWQVVMTGDGQVLAIAPTTDMFHHLAQGPGVNAA